MSQIIAKTDTMKSSLINSVNLSRQEYFFIYFLKRKTTSKLVIKKSFRCNCPMRSALCKCEVSGFTFTTSFLTLNEQVDVIDLPVQLQYNTVKPNLKGSAILLLFRDSCGFKKAKIKKRKLPDLIYLSVYPLDSV